MSRPLSCRFFFKTFLQLSINRANFVALQPPFRVVNPSIQTHFYMVGVLGFEPRTSSLSGTRSNQLSYTPGCLPLRPPLRESRPCRILVELKGFEPSTSCLQSRCSSRLSYSPGSPSPLVPSPELHSLLKQPRTFLRAV